MNISTNPFVSPEDFKAELSDGSAANQQQQQHHFFNQPYDQMASLNLVAELDMKKNSVNSYLIEPNEEAASENDGENNNGVQANNNNNANKANDEGLEEHQSGGGGGSADGGNDITNLADIDGDLKPPRDSSQQQKQQQIMAKNANKIFRPILNFIGVDAPSGTLIDNLFKEFGALLFGNLNIKSVHINILGSAFSMTRLLGETPSSTSLANSSAVTAVPGVLAKGPTLTASGSQAQFRTRSFYRY